MSASPGQVARRKFDHAEAVRRHAAGETVAALAREYGVSWTAVARVVDPATGAKMAAQSARNRRASRKPCLGGCGVLVWKRGASSTATGYCPSCLGAKRHVVRHGTENEYSYGCRCDLCRAAASDAKRRRRAQSRVPCSHGCGTLVDSINRAHPEKPPECHPCAMKRIFGKQRVPVAA